VLIDLWGHGLTDTPLVAHEPALFHSLLESLLIHLKWDNAHFVGYSFGGATVAPFASAYPQRVSSFVLVAPAGLIRAARYDELWNSYLRGGEGVSEEKVQEWVLETLEGGPLTVPPDWKEKVSRGEVVAEAIKEWELKNHRGHMASVVGIFRDGGVLDRQAAFVEAAKTGIRNISVVGESDDWSTKKDLNEVGFGDVVVVPNVGHGVVRERVAEVASVIEGFWKGL
jgi:pimeloyl-ACP methyl ester carboxylesterase